MAIKTVLDTLDGVDDAVKPFYAQDGERYVLQVEGIDHHPEVANLKSAYERTKADKQAMATERDAFKAKVANLPEDFDPEVWKRAKAGKPDEAELVKVRQTLETRIADLEKQLDGERATTRKTVLERDLTDALTAAGVTESVFVKAARTMLEPTVKIVDGKPVVETDMGPMPLAQHVARWVGGEGKAFVTAPKGGGAKGGQGGTGQTVSRAVFDGMSQTRRAEFLKSGGTIADDA